jgi:exopolysaccharide production protein ExoQ
MDKLGSRFENGFIIFSLAFFIGSPLGILGAYGIQNLIFLLIYATTWIILACNAKSLAANLRSRNLSFFVLPACLLIFVLLSTLWSQYPLITLQRSFFLVSASCLGVYFGCVYSQVKQLDILAKAFTLVILLSFIYAIVPPNYGISQEIHVGAWRGIFLAKNGLAYSMALSAIVFIHLPAESTRKKIFKLVFLGLSILLIVLSTGKGGLLIFVALLAIYWACKMMQRIRWDILMPSLFGLSLIGGVLGLIAFYSLEFFLNSMGKEMTLSSRAEIWYGIWSAIQKRPLLGYGYGSFWEGELNSTAASTVMFYADWVTNPHNGLLDLLINIGFVGTCLYLMIFLCFVGRSLYLVRLSKSPDYIWPFCLLSYLFFSNLAEANSMGFKDISWILYMSIIGCLSVKSNVIVMQRQGLMV